MDPAYAQRYRRLYENHFWWRARERMLVERIEALEFPRGGHVLDVGCGDGLFFPQLARFGDVHGIEADARLVPEDSPHRGAIHVGELDDEFTPGRSFALIVMLDVLEHLDRPAVALARARALLVPGGVLLITVPAFRLLWSAHDAWNQHRTRFTVPELEALVRSAGMRVERAEYFYHWLFVAKLASCARERLLGGTAAPADVPKPLVNRLAYAVSRAEQRLFARRPLPFGSSLYAVVRP